MNARSVTRLWPVFAGGLTAVACSLAVAACGSDEPTRTPTTVVAIPATPIFTTPAWARGYKPCATEDSAPCFWDAAQMGDHWGANLLIHADGRVEQFGTVPRPTDPR